MPENVPKKEIKEEPARPDVLPPAPATEKLKPPVELEFDEADALFRKRTDP